MVHLTLLNFLKKYNNNNKIFIETGSFNGDGIETALKTNLYSKIYSIELSKFYHDKCTNRFIRNNKVNIVFGDSGLMLKELLKDINEPCTFWLDGHYSAGNTACAEDYCSPIMLELESIKNHTHKGVKNHVILIDDMNGFTEKMIDENIKINGKCGYVLKNELENKIREINKDYRIVYDNNVCICY